MVIPKSEAAERGAQAAKADIVDTLQAKLRSRGVKAEVRLLSSNDREIVYRFKAGGTGDVESFRTLIHTIVKPQFSLIGGVTEIQIDPARFESPDVVLVLEANPSTGYCWLVKEGKQHDRRDTSRVREAYTRYRRSRAPSSSI